MVTAALAAAVSLIAGVMVAIVTSALTRKREHESEWRKLKFGQYQELLAAISGIVEGRSTPQAHARYADAVNSMALVAPSPVLMALHAFQNEISCKNISRSQTAHDRLLGDLLRALRADMLPKGADDAGIQFRLISTPPSDGSKATERGA